MSKQIALVPFDKIEKIELYINKSRKTIAGRENGSKKRFRRF